MIDHATTTEIAVRTRITTLAAEMTRAREEETHTAHLTSAAIATAAEMTIATATLAVSLYLCQSLSLLGYPHPLKLN